MRGMDKRRKHPCVNTLNKWLPVNTFIGNLNMPRLKKVSVVWEGGGVSREQECHSHHQLSWLHLPDPAMYTHTHLNAIPMFSVHLPWLSKPMYTILTVVEIQLHTHTPKHNSDSSRDTHILILQSSSRDQGGCIPMCSRWFAPGCVKISAT